MKLILISLLIVFSCASVPHKPTAENIDLSEIINRVEKDEAIHFSVEKAHVPTVLSALLVKVPVEDVGIEDEDIANVIELIITKGMQHVASNQ